VIGKLNSKKSNKVVDELDDIEEEVEEEEVEEEDSDEDDDDEESDDEKDDDEEEVEEEEEEVEEPKVKKKSKHKEIIAKLKKKKPVVVESEPNEQNKPNVEEQRAREIELLQNNGVFRFEMLYQVNQLNKNLSVLNSLINKAVGEDGEK